MAGNVRLGLDSVFPVSELLFELPIQEMLYELLEAGGKPSTWLPPGELVEHSSKIESNDDDSGDDDDDDNAVSTWQRVAPQGRSVAQTAQTAQTAEIKLP